MAKKSIDERIAELQKKQEQLKAQEKQLKAKAKQDERKARTKRLITIGATVESIIGSPIENDQLDQLAERLRQNQNQETKTDIQTQIGYIAESVLGRSFTEEDLVKFRLFLENQEKRGGYFGKAMD